MFSSGGPLAIVPYIYIYIYISGGHRLIFLINFFKNGSFEFCRRHSEYVCYPNND